MFNDDKNAVKVLYFDQSC